MLGWGCTYQGDGAPSDGACSEAATAEEFACGHCEMVDWEIVRFFCVCMRVLLTLVW